MWVARVTGDFIPRSGTPLPCCGVGPVNWTLGQRGNKEDRGPAAPGSTGHRPASPPYRTGLFRRRLRGLLDSGSVAALPVGGVATARAQLEAGEAALAAGATQAGIDLLRGAARQARVTGDDALSVRVWLALGGALVHTMRGHEEAATVLHKAADAACRLGDRVMAATAYREIAFIDVQACRRQRARVWLDRAEAAAFSKQVRETQFPDVGWDRSYVVKTDAGLHTFCIYEADNPERVVEHARAARLPADAIHEVVMVVDPAAL